MPDTGNPIIGDSTGLEPPHGELDVAADHLDRQVAVLGLEELLLRNWADGVPDSKQLIFGGGAQPEQTLIGDQGVQYRAAAIFNYSSAPVTVGFASGAGLFTAFTVEPGTGMVLPQTYRDLSLSVSNQINQGPTLTPITVLRLFVAPLAPLVFALTGPAGVADTLSAFGTVIAPAAGATIATLTPGVAGAYQVAVSAEAFGAGLVAGDVANMQLVKISGATTTVLGRLIYGSSAAAAPSVAVAPAAFRVALGAADTLAVQAVGIGTAGVTYTATIQATRLI
jgi:hypothetical protein